MIGLVGISCYCDLPRQTNETFIWQVTYLVNIRVLFFSHFRVFFCFVILLFGATLVSIDLLYC